MEENDIIQNTEAPEVEPEVNEQVQAEETKEQDEKREAIEVLKKYAEEDDEDDMGEFSLRAILGGDILQSRFILNQVMFIIFCVAMALAYTGNRYSSQQDSIIIDSLRNRLQEVKYNVMTQSSELLNISRQSNVERRLRQSKDSVLETPLVPPFLIKKDSIN